MSAAGVHRLFYLYVHLGDAFGRLREGRARHAAERRRIHVRRRSEHRAVRRRGAGRRAAERPAARVGRRAAVDSRLRPGRPDNRIPAVRRAERVRLRAAVPRGAIQRHRRRNGQDAAFARGKRLSVQRAIPAHAFGGHRRQKHGRRAAELRLALHQCGRRGNPLHRHAALRRIEYPCRLLGVEQCAALFRRAEQPARNLL